MPKEDTDDDLRRYALTLHQENRQLRDCLKAIVIMFGNKYPPDTIGGKLFNRARVVLGSQPWIKEESWDEYRERSRLPFSDKLEGE